MTAQRMAVQRRHRIVASHVGNVPCDVELVWNPGRDCIHSGSADMPNLVIVAVMVNGEDVPVSKSDMEELHMRLWDQLCEKS